jgi:hypothetical protein
MVEREALIVALIAFVAACVCIVLRSDCSLFVFRGQFSLSALLLLLAVGPPMIAAAWFLWPHIYSILSLRQGTTGLN